MSYSIEQKALIHEAYLSMLADIKPHVNDAKQLALIDDAYHYCLERYDGKYMVSGKAYMFHLIEMARIAVLEVGLGYMSVVGAFLHGITYKEGVDIKEIEGRYGKTIAAILLGFDKISALKTEKVAYNSDNFRVLFLSLIEDMRTVLLKVVHRIYDVRNQSDVDADRLGKYFHEIKYIYIPIVHRLGLYKLKAEMEEKLLLYENPDVFHEIQRKIEATKEAHQQTVDRFLAPIIRELDAESLARRRSGKCKFDYEVKWRIKSIPSIYAKMNAKNVPFEEVYDLLAARIIIRCALKDEQECCWGVYSIITNLYEPNPERLRDWITHPKASGYESLHTTVKYDDKFWIEVQIRTTRMDEVAETGQAAHYLYKGEKATSEEWLLNVREVLENPGLVSFENSYKKIYKSDKIFIFTPEGDLKVLPEGSTVLDFAYEVHTIVGETCNGAKVNGRVVPIRQPLANGDKVEIITSKKQSPRADWLNFVATEKAKNRIRRFLKEQELKEAELGKGLLQRRLKNWKFPVTEEVVDMLVKEYKLENPLQLYHQISTEKIDLVDVKKFLSEKFGEHDEKSEHEEPEIIDFNRKESSTDGTYLSIGKDIDNVNFKVAQCCHPIPGDKVFGCVTTSGKITLHRTNCTNAKSLMQSHGNRIINVTWKTSKKDQNQVALLIKGNDEMGLLVKISTIIANLKLNTKSSSFDSKKNGCCEGKFVIEVSDVDVLDNLIKELRSIDGVIEVKRIDE